MANILDQMSRPSTPYYALHSKIGILLIHGFLGSPHELRPLADQLVASQYTVLALLLPGHGGNPEALKGIAWQQWYTHCQAELERLKKDCDHVIVIGFSMGGLLATMLATDSQIDGLVLMAAAWQLRLQKQMALAKWISYLMPWMYPFKDSDFTTPEVQTNVRQYLPDADFTNQALIARLRKEVRIPLASIGQLVALQTKAARKLERIEIPTLLIQGKTDQTVNPDSLEFAKAHLTNTTPTTAFFDCGHILMYENQSDQICEHILSWLKVHTSALRKGNHEQTN